MSMTRYELEQILKVAKALAEGHDEVCSRLFGYLIEAMDTLPVHHIDYVFEEDEKSEEDEE